MSVDLIFNDFLPQTLKGEVIENQCSIKGWGKRWFSKNRHYGQAL